MRTLGLSLFLLLAAAGPGSAPPLAPGTWTPQTSGVTTSLNGVAAFNSTEVFAVGAGGVIRRSLDGGTLTWAAQTSAPTGTLNGVGVGSADIAAAVGDAGLIVQTVNGSNVGGSTWTQVNTTGDFSAVAATDATHAWSAGAAGSLRLTSDGGTTWPLGSPGSTTIAARGMSFLTAPTEGYWVGDMGTVMKTTNGTTWAPAPGPVGTTNTLNSISMVASSALGSATGWIAGNGGLLRKTTNSGLMWTNPTSGTPQNLNGVFAGDTTHAWAVGNGPVITATSNGNTWATQPAPPMTANLNAVSMVNDAGMWKGVAVGANGTAIFTTNAGMIWTKGTTPSPVTLRGVAMLSPMNAVAVGDGGTLLQSLDGGNTWTQINSGLTTLNLLAVSFGSATAGWAVGADGSILSTTTSGGAWQFQVGGTSQNLKDLKYGALDKALAVGASGTILRSVNQGSLWTPLTNLGAPWTASNLNAVAFGTPTRAVAVGSSGGILATDNTGDAWVSVPAGALTAELYSVSAVSATTFVAVGGTGIGVEVTITFDTTSSTWTATPAASVPPFGLKGVSFPPYSRQGYGVADSGLVFVTKDAGSTFNPETAASANNLHGVTFISQSLGWAVGDNGTILVRRSPEPPLLSFPPHIGTPYTWSPPIVDGFINPELTERRRPDTGWNQGLQVSYADGTSQPPFTFQGLRQNGGNYLYLSFDMKADTGFDADDAIVLLFRGDNPTSRLEHAANDRRIIINPLSTGTGSPAGAVVAEGYVAPSPAYTNNENGAPRTLTSYRWNTGTNAWTVIPASTEITCKVRSWIPSTGNFCWSVELKIPTVNTTYTDWINIGTDFLFSFYALRVQTGGVVESSWPRDLALSGPADLVDAPMSALDWGTAKLGTADDGVGVRIKVLSYQNIGVTTPSTPPGTLEDTIHGTLENTFHVFVQNNVGTAADNVQATFRIADWGVQSGDPSSGAWHLVPANQSTVNPPAAATVPAISGTTPGVTEYTCKWLMNSTERADYAAHDHQCILVTLDSTSDVNFVERSSWTNMAYVPSSRFDRKAFVSSKGYGLDGARKGLQRFYLHTTSERFDYTPGKTPLEVVAKPAAKRDGQADNTKGEHPYYTGENLQRERLLAQFPGLKAEKTTVSHYTWAIHAVKETSRTVKINGHVYPLLEQANGFGYIARHGSEVDQWTSGLSGAIVKKLNENEYEVEVPANGSAALDTGLESREGGATSAGGLFGLMLLILLFLIIIFWFLKKKP